MKLGAALWLPAGAAVLAAATGALFAGAAWAALFFYLFAWCGSLLCLAGLQGAVLGGSFLEEPRRLARMAALSVPWWLLFEAANLRLRNWSYEGLPPSLWVRWCGYALAFATVLPAVLECARLLERVLGNARVAPMPCLLGRRARGYALALGLAFAILPLLWPRLFFPLVWGAVFLLGEPWLAEYKPERSWLSALAQGRPAPALSLLLSGAACGLLWELFNYWSGGRWRYSVPWPAGPKLFEMPWAGYLGFPPFALECGSYWGMIETLEERLNKPTKTALVLALVALSLAVFVGIDTHTVTRFTAWP